MFTSTIHIHSSHLLSTNGRRTSRERQLSNPEVAPINGSRGLTSFEQGESFRQHVQQLDQDGEPSSRFENGNIQTSSSIHEKSLNADPVSDGDIGMTM